MPIDADGATWRAFLDAFQSYSNVEVSELVAKESVQLDPIDASIVYTYSYPTSMLRLACGKRWH